MVRLAATTEPTPAYDRDAFFWDVYSRCKDFPAFKVTSYTDGEAIHAVIKGDGFQHKMKITAHGICIKPEGLQRFNIDNLFKYKIVEPAIHTFKLVDASSPLPVVSHNAEERVFQTHGIMAPEVGVLIESDSNLIVIVRMHKADGTPLWEDLYTALLYDDAKPTFGGMRDTSPIMDKSQWFLSKPVEMEPTEVYTSVYVFDGIRDYRMDGPFKRVNNILTQVAHVCTVRTFNQFQFGFTPMTSDPALLLPPIKTEPVLWHTSCFYEREQEPTEGAAAAPYRYAIAEHAQMQKATPVTDEDGV